MTQLNDRIRELTNIKFDPFIEWTYAHQVEYDDLLSERDRMLKEKGIIR